MENSAYDKQDEILDQVEPVFLSFAGEMGLKKVKTNRWHWDSPDFSLMWEEGGLQRSVCAFIVNDSTVRIECNACKGEGETRKWRYLCVGQADASSEDCVKGLLKTAYEAVAAWKEEDLT